MTTTPLVGRSTTRWPAVPGGRGAAGLRRVLLLLAIALTVMAGPLGRPIPDQAPADEIFRPVAVSSFSPTH